MSKKSIPKETLLFYLDMLIMVLNTYTKAIIKNYNIFKIAKNDWYIKTNFDVIYFLPFWRKTDGLSRSLYAIVFNLCVSVAMATIAKHKHFTQ